MTSHLIAIPDEEQVVTIDFSPADSAALQRLIMEVKQRDDKALFDTTLYNRTYHRHNR